MNEMAPSLGDSKPNPDPTIATNEAVARAVKAERDYVDGQVGILVQRLDGIDKATIVLNETVNRVPTALQEGLGHLQAVMDERFDSIDKQFKERDTRSERESRDNKVAVDAAFAAQKEAAAKQDEANAKAIDKSERATAETIKTNYELAAAKTDALTQRLDALTVQVAQIVATKQGATDTRTEHRASTTSSTQIIASAIALLGVLVLASSIVISVYLSHH